MRTAAALLSLLISLAGAAGAAEKPAPPRRASFASAPAASTAGGKTTITFTVKSPCPAAVWIEDGAGKIVRHLAAGMLGDKAPPPFQKGLTQKLVWDGKDDAGKPAPAGCLVKVGLGLSAKLDKFLAHDPQNAGTVLSTATDAEGNVYVMSHDDFPIRSTPQVMVFGPDGKYLRTLLPWAANVPFERVKDYWVDLGAAGKVPRVHHLFQGLYPLGPKQRKRTWDEVVNISGEDLELTPGQGKPRPSRGKGLFRPMHVVADRSREGVLVRQWAGAKWVRIDGRSGEVEPLPFSAADVALDAEGYIYAHSGGYQVDGKLTRYSPDGKPAPFPGGANSLTVPGTIRGGNMRGVRGLTVAPDGSIYVLHFKGHQDKDKDWSTVLLDVLAPDGKVRRRSVLTLTAGAGCVRVDRAGNMWVAEDVMPPDQPLPPEFAAVKGRDRYVYSYIYGSILKFGSKGGKVTAYRRGREKPPEEGVRGVNRHWSGTRQVRVTGELKGFFPGVAPTGSGSGMCACYVPHFDLDGFGRAFVPDVPRFSVRVLDSAGNQLARIGTYGNADSAGPGSKVPQPKIPFGWPAYVAVTDEAVYVSDMLNRRVARLTLHSEVEETCPLR
ncbi:MAG: hypothetical protein ACYTGB_01985 [Planctomycetota bacterium]|jgi:hypothetical protein